MTLDPLDAPYYERARDGRRIHVCQMPGHTQYWLNVGAALWICAGCHPPLLGSDAGKRLVDIVDKIVNFAHLCYNIRV